MTKNTSEERDNDQVFGVPVSPLPFVFGGLILAGIETVWKKGHLESMVKQRLIPAIAAGFIFSTVYHGVEQSRGTNEGYVNYGLAGAITGAVYGTTWPGKFTWNKVILSSMITSSLVLGFVRFSRINEYTEGVLQEKEDKEWEKRHPHLCAANSALTARSIVRNQVAKFSLKSPDDPDDD